MNPLDNMVWASVSGAHRELGEHARSGPALRFHPDVSPFAAIESDTPAAWEALAEVIGPGGIAVLFGAVVSKVPADWEVLLTESATQYEANELAPDPNIEVDRLGPQDVPDMIALAELTEPGPFGPRTIETGRYFGVREEGRLIAMAGERMRAAEWVEISAVCVHPGAQRRGLGSAMTLTVAHRILAEGRRPMLHVREGNDPANTLYSKLGFRLRREIHVFAVRKR